MKLPVWGYNPVTKKLFKELIERPKEMKGKHIWVSACDIKGNQLFGFCELCGKRRE